MGIIEYTNEVMEQLKEFTEFSDYDFRIEKIRKPNVVLTGLICTEKGSEIGKNLYMDNFYKSEMPVSETVSKLKNIILDMSDIIPSDIMSTFSKDKIFPVLINAGKNEELISDLPHRFLEDLTIIYEWHVDQRGNKFGSVRITNALAQLLHLSEQDLFDCAKANAVNVVRVCQMNSMLEELGMAMPPDTELPKDCPIIMTSISNCKGAGMVVMLDKLFKDEKFIILPSSIHEVLLVPLLEQVSEEQIDNFEETVHYVNENKLDEEDFLSDNVYYFDSQVGFILARKLINKNSTDHNI